MGLLIKTIRNRCAYRFSLPIMAASFFVFPAYGLDEPDVLSSPQFSAIQAYPAVQPASLSQAAPQASFEFYSQPTPKNVAPVFPSAKGYQLSIDQIRSELGPYDHRFQEALQRLGDKQFDQGDYVQAVATYNEALHIARISHGLYHESQIKLLERLIESDQALQDWTAAYDRYTYLELLYKRLFDTNDPRLERGLLKVTNWHVNAINANIDNLRIEHLRRVRNLYRTRMDIAKLTLNESHPRISEFEQSIAICERQLFLASDAYKEFFLNSKATASHQNQRQGQRFIATID